MSGVPGAGAPGSPSSFYIASSQERFADLDGLTGARAADARLQRRLDALLIVEFTRGLSPRLQVVNDVIWIAFIAQFGLEFIVAPDKRLYLRKRWVTACRSRSPALRLVRRASGEAGFEDYGAALWWTAMLLTTMGSDYWPRTPEGRILCLLLATYAFAVFGYVTAAIAAYFVGKDRDATVA